MGLGTFTSYLAGASPRASPPPSPRASPPPTPPLSPSASPRASPLLPKTRKTSFFGRRRDPSPVSVLDDVMGTPPSPKRALPKGVLCTSPTWQASKRKVRRGRGGKRVAFKSTVSVLRFVDETFDYKTECWFQSTEYGQMVRAELARRRHFGITSTSLICATDISHIEIGDVLVSSSKEERSSAMQRSSSSSSSSEEDSASTAESDYDDDDDACATRPVDFEIEESSDAPEYGPRGPVVLSG